MLVHLLRLVVCVSLVTVAWSQKLGTPEYEREARRGYDAIMAGKNDEGIVIFKKLVELNPTDSISSYNVACGYAKKNELEPAFEWLGKAADLGFGHQASTNPVDNITLAAEKDTDLASMRSDPRFAPLIERMRAMKKALDAYVAEPAIYVPKALEGVEQVPLLVVLHDAGSTKDQIVAGWWKSVADELGFALVAPSGTILIGQKPTDGMRWYDEVALYAARNWVYERTIEAGLAAFAKQRKYDRTCVYLAGVGEGGSVALSVAVGAPTIYKGVVAFNAGVVEKLVSSKAAAAGKAGLQAQLFAVAEPAAPAAPVVPGRDVARDAQVLAQRLKDWGVRGTAEAIEPPSDDAARVARVVAAIKGMLLAPKPAPAAGK